MKARSNLEGSSTYPIIIFGILVITFMWVTGRVEATLIEYMTAFGGLTTLWLGRETKQAVQEHYKQVNHGDN